MAALLAWSASESIAAPAKPVPAVRLVDAMPTTHRALSPGELRTLLPGLLLTGEYRNGAPWTERFSHDGTSRYTDTAGTADGTVRFLGAGVCFTYADTALSGGCFEVWRRGRRCFDFYGDNVTATLGDRRFGRGWTARAWLPGGREDCRSDLLS